MSNSYPLAWLFEETAIQLSMDFWPGGVDPNQCSCDSFTFHSHEFRSALQFLNLPSRCPDALTVQVSKSEMALRVTAQGGESFASARLRLVESSGINQDICLIVSREIATRLANVLEGTCTFHVNHERTEISFTQETFSAAISATPSNTSPGLLFANGATVALDARELARALSFATLLKRSYIPASHNGYHGARICNGVVMGGSHNAISSYSSPSIPKELDFAVPHNTTSNARHVLPHLRSCQAYTDSDKVIFRNSDLGLECGWYTSSANWPSAILAAFDNHVPYFRRTVDVGRLASRALLHTIPSNKKPVFGHFTPAGLGTPESKLLLISNYPHGTAVSTVADLYDGACDTEGLLQTQFRMADVAMGAYALGMGKAEMALSEFAMLLTAQEDNVTKKILFSAEIRR